MENFNGLMADKLCFLPKNEVTWNRIDNIGGATIVYNVCTKTKIGYIKLKNFCIMTSDDIKTLETYYNNLKEYVNEIWEEK